MFNQTNKSFNETYPHISALVSCMHVGVRLAFAKTILVKVLSRGFQVGRASFKESILFYTW